MAEKKVNKKHEMSVSSRRASVVKRLNSVVEAYKVLRDYRFFDTTYFELIGFNTILTKECEDYNVKKEHIIMIGEYDKEKSLKISK